MWKRKKEGTLQLLWPNHPVLGTAARLRLGMNVKGIVRAAARDGERSPFASLRENAALSGSCLPSAPLRENQALETDPPSGDRSAPR